MRETDVPEAAIEDTEHGRVVSSEGWFVLNLGDAAAHANEQAGTYVPFESDDHRWPEFGANVHIVQPGQPNCFYHQESAQEAFLVLSGECVLIVEEQERPLKQWDFFHCPSGTRHVFVGTGDGPCAILMIGARPEENDIHYPVSDVAGRHGASVTVATDVPREAYAEWPGPFTPARSPWPIR
jgi:uncharacterized cupin superfamily protein